MISTVTLLLALSCLLALAASGCGGEDDSADASGFDKAAFLAQANAACKRERAGVDKELTEVLQRERGRMPLPEAYAEASRLVILSTIEDELEAIRAIKVPLKVSEEVSDVLYIEQRALDEMVFEKRLSSLEEVDRRFAESEKTLIDYGFTDCVNGPGSS